MPNICLHEPPETKRGVGPCRIEAEVRLRNGKPNWWCRVHGQAAGAPDGSPLTACPGSWFDAVPEDRRLDLRVGDGEFAVWGAVEPALTIGTVPNERGRVHVHHRPHAGAAKDIDASFDIVSIWNQDHRIVVEGIAAVAASISELSGRPISPLACSHCRDVHLDELKFATRPHTKHLCNSCGRNFRASSPSISNPLSDARHRLGLAERPAAVVVSRPLAIQSSGYEGVAIWPSNSAIVSTMTRPEEFGTHVHAWDSRGRLVTDETFSTVSVDGIAVDAADLRLLAIQRHLAHGAPIRALACEHCGLWLAGTTRDWIEPRTSHHCEQCGGETRTNRKVFVNRLADKLPR